MNKNTTQDRRTTVNLDDLFPSKFLSQNDVPQPIVVTIARLTQEEMKDKGATSKKPVVHFVEGMKPWILNKGNAKRIAALQAQGEIRAMNGSLNTWFAGAWMKNGFHEDGFASALDVVEAMRSGARERQLAA